MMLTRMMFGAALLMAVHPAQGETVGAARVTDGQTLEISGKVIRLKGISAPGLKQTCQTRKGRQQMCGILAQKNMQKLARGEISCVGEETDAQGHLVATCFSGPIDLNEYMVLDGWALAYPRDDNPYLRAEGFAKARREGIWRNKSFERPWDWRAANGE